MLLYMQAYLNSLVALGTQHFNSTLVKHRFRSQRSPINTILILCWWLTYNFLHYFILLSVSLFLVSSLLSCPTTPRSFPNKVRALSFTSLTKVSNKPSSWCHSLFSWKLCSEHLHNLLQTLVFDIARNVPT